MVLCLGSRDSWQARVATAAAIGRVQASPALPCLEKARGPSYPMLDLHAARIIGVHWHVQVTTGAATRLSVGLGHVAFGLGVGLRHVTTRLSVRLGHVTFGLRIVPWKHDLLSFPLFGLPVESGSSQIA